MVRMKVEQPREILVMIEVEQCSQCGKQIELSYASEPLPLLELPDGWVGLRPPGYQQPHYASALPVSMCSWDCVRDYAAARLQEIADAAAEADKQAALASAAS